MEDIITVGVIIGAILSLILFFKIWKACNDIKRIADKYAPKPHERTNTIRSTVETKEELERWLNEDK